MAIFALILEGGAYILTVNQLLPINEKPVSEFHVGAPRGLTWRNENSEWGAWHKINYQDKHISACINVEYKSNNYGARDEDFDINITADYLLIGDSFAEGYGVNKEQIFESRIEKQYSKNIFNFGSAGHFGPLQEYIIYEKLAKKFKHNELLITFLPANDFTDNDPIFWRGRDVIDLTGAQRYRPYWRLKNDASFDWFYPERAAKTDCFGCPPPTLRTFLIRYSYTGNLIRTLELLYPGYFNYRKDSELVQDPPTYSGYFDSKEIQQKAALYFYKKIIVESYPTPIKLIIIPAKNDLIRIKNGEIYKNQYWYKEMNAMQNQYSNFKFIDLALHIPDNYNDLFLSCDGHWSKNGHEWAAKIIGEFLER